jgi:NADH-quinone oxidoreductase subunit J
VIEVTPLAFYLISIVVLTAAIYAVSSPKLLNSALALALCFFAVGGLYAIIGVPFLAVLQILINAGAIPIVTVFIIMMTQSRITTMRVTQAWWYLGAFVAMGAAFVMVFLRLRDYGNSVGATLDTVTPVATRQIGERLLSSPVTNGQAGTLFAFEAASVLLLVGMIGAIILAKREGEVIKGDVGVFSEAESPVRSGEARELSTPARRAAAVEEVAR